MRTKKNYIGLEFNGWTVKEEIDRTWSHLNRRLLISDGNQTKTIWLGQLTSLVNSEFSNDNQKDGDCCPAKNTSHKFQCLPLNQEQVNFIVSEVIQNTQINSLNSKIGDRAQSLIKKSNPYRLFEFEDDTEFLRHILSTSQETSWQTHLGKIFETIQIQISGGTKSSERGMDYFIPPNIYLGAKSSSSWANSDQRKSMQKNAETLSSKGFEIYVICSYGNSDKEYDSYTQLSGKKGWEFISGDENMYKKILTALEVEKNTIATLKNKIYKNLESEVLDFWVSNFYIENKFNKQKYLDYVSKKSKTRKKNNY